MFASDTEIEKFIRENLYVAAVCVDLIGPMPYFSTVDPPHLSGENRSRFWHKKGRPVRSGLVKNRCESFFALLRQRALQIKP